ncbi:hypothetical protein D3C85_607400 [compost metagenome]
MPTIATDTQRLSDWLKHEYEPSSGVTREVAAVADVTGATVTGSVLDSNYDLVVTATAADAKYILMSDLTAASYGTGQFTKALLLARGPAKVNADKLVFGTITAPAIVTALGALKVLGIHADEGF